LDWPHKFRAGFTGDIVPGFSREGCEFEFTVHPNGIGAQHLFILCYHGASLVFEFNGGAGNIHQYEICISLVGYHLTELWSLQNRRCARIYCIAIA